MAAEDYVVIPVKGLRSGKSRLSAAIPEDVRHALNRMQLMETLAAVVPVFGARNCVVVSSCPEVRALVRQENVRYIEENAPHELNDALTCARSLLRAEGARTLTIVPVDLIHISAPALSDVLDRRRLADCFVVPDDQLLGTNVLRFPVAALFQFQYGPDSCCKHVQALTDCGISPAVYADSVLTEDLDSVAQFIAEPRCWHLMKSAAGINPVSCI